MPPEAAASTVDSTVAAARHHVLAACWFRPCPHAMSVPAQAVLLGSVADDAFTVDAPIAVDPYDKTLSIIVTEPSPIDAERAVAGQSLVGRLSRAQLTPAKQAALIGLQGKPSLTDFHLLARGERASACRVHPVTGRMHQIRVHAELAGYPLAGDTQYGLRHQPSPRCSRLLLHAHSLEVAHPARHQLVRFTAAPPVEFRREAEALGLPPLEALAPSGVEWLGPAQDDSANAVTSSGWRNRDRTLKRGRL